MHKMIWGVSDRVTHNLLLRNICHVESSNNKTGPTFADPWLLLYKSQTNFKILHINAVWRYE